MSAASLVVCLSLCLTGVEIESGTQLVYRGTVTPLRPIATDGGKSFDLTVLVAAADAKGAKLFWTIEESGRSGWPWSERFGEIELDASYHSLGSHAPSVLYDFGEGTHAVPLMQPLFIAESTLAAGTTWQQGGLDYTVEGSRQVLDEPAWTVVARSGTGVRRTLALGKEDPLILELSEPVIMNRGTEYELKMSLVSSDPLDAESLKSQLQAFEALVGLRSRLQRPQASAKAWSGAERETIAAALPALEQIRSTGAVSRIVAAIGRDLDTQSNTAAAIDQLIADRQGKPVSEFLPDDAGSEALRPAAFDDHVTVLHFWDYRDQPLTAPYGQVGYLEFLSKRHKAAGVRVIGIATDERFADAKSRPEAAASLRKLVEFMKLTYPIVPDEPGLLEHFGDPRKHGASLPLVVVVDRQGRIQHVHTGFYEVDRKDGLKELDEIVTRLSQARPVEN